MKNRSLAIAVAAVAATAFAAGSASARDQVKIAGSSTVFPYAKIVAEAFAKANPKLKAPVVESGGSGAGIKQFCDGVGEDKIDIADSSRRIKKTEQATCASNGVADIVEVKFGYDGIVFASDVKGPAFAYQPKDWFLALAPKIPQNGKLVDNTNKTWKQVNAEFPEWEIAAFIPGEKHGTREVFETKVLVAGCKAAGADKLYEADLKAAGTADDKLNGEVEKSCAKVRKDDGGKHAVDIDGDYTETLARLQANKQSIGVFGLAFYENNTDKLRVATVGGIKPSVDTIAAGQYPVSRPLFFYVKKAHVGVIPGLKEYAEFFVTDKMIGQDGPLAAYGLVPLPANEAEAVRATVKNLTLLGELKS